MKITPIDIAHKSFGKRMMGLDTDEVMDFLQQVAAQMEALIQDRNSLKEALREKELSLMEYKERDQVLKETIATATQMADRLRQDAEREAKLITADANQKAEIITRDSRDSLKRMYQEVNELKRARMQFEANLKALAQAHLSLLEQGEKYMPQMHLQNQNFVNNPNSTGTATGNTRSTNISPLSAE
ncbi:DivIVA domain-containing protein [Bdellovibrio sp. KM01]|uniref:DivIVA domain-containing protein n=1 Tax=Bdellovibrio sp. KM01 TaxID=2748865 RepID=UPI002107BC8F|nr:DivIVA domain-containing protein [Bdellovibrio sp. KM01]